MRNPNGYGTVAKLTGNRRRPYIVKKTVGWKENGQPIYDIIGYADTWEKGNLMLAQYNHEPWDIDRAKITLNELYELFKANKLPKLGRSNSIALKSAYKHCAAHYSIPYRNIKAYHMQNCIDGCARGASTQAHILNLWKHLDNYAKELDIPVQSYSTLLSSAPMPETKSRPLTNEEIEALWGASGKPWVDTILILIYSGWRVSEMLSLKKEDIDTNSLTMQGGVKTKAGKGRIVPIHSLIVPFVEQRFNNSRVYLIEDYGEQCSYSIYRQYWNEIMTTLGFNTTPHKCRHTFRSLLDSAGANKVCMDLMTGHKSSGTGERIYTHKTIEELRENIELIKRKPLN